MKQLIANYSFNAASKTVTLTDFGTIKLERLQLIVDTTTNAILYNFADSTIATATVATNVITLSTVGSASSTDKLQIIYDTAVGDPNYSASTPILGTQSAVNSTAWTSATSGNTANSISVAGYNTVSVAMSNTSTMTGGVLTFEVSPDGGTTWFPIAVARIDTYTVETTYTLNAVANRAWSTSVDGFTNFRVRLSTVITGTGTANVFVVPQTFAIEPIVSVGQATAANLNATVVPGNPTGSAVPANAFYMAGTSAGTLTGVSALQASGDGNNTTNVGLVSGAFGYLFNSSTWDRTRSSVHAANTTGTGIVATGIMAELDDGSTTTVTENQFAHLRMTPERGLHVSIRPSTNSGATTFTLVSAATTNATSVKASAGTLLMLSATNNSATVAFLKLYNKASAPTVGTDTPVLTFMLPANGGTNVAIPATGLNFSTGIAYALTALATTADTTAVALSQVQVNGAYI